MNIKLHKIKSPKIETFQFGVEPEIIHIIQSGFPEKKLVVWEDAYELDIGKVELLTKKEIEKRFNIKIDE